MIKKILFSLLLAISISYGDVEDDLIYISNTMTDCANKDKVKYVALMANINQYNNGKDIFQAVKLFADYVNKYCSNEANMINRISSDYNAKGQAAIIAQLIAMQMENISNWFAKGTKQFDNITNEILK